MPNSQHKEIYLPWKEQAVAEVRAVSESIKAAAGVSAVVFKEKKQMSVLGKS